MSKSSPPLSLPSTLPSLLLPPQNTSSFTITQYHVTSWPEQGQVSPQLLIKLITHLNKLQRSTENKPITVMCKCVCVCVCVCV